MSYLTSTGSMFSLTAPTEMLCFASGRSCPNNVNMHSDSKLLIFFQSTSVTFSSVSPASLTPAPPEHDFCMRSQIRLGYLTVWHFQRSQPLLVHLVPSMLIFAFDTGFRGAGCQRSGPGWGRSAQPINSQHALWDPSSLPPLLWSRGPNLWPYHLLNMLQNYSSSGSVKRSARAQRGLSDKAMGTKAREGKKEKNSRTADPEFLNVKNSILFFCFTAIELFTKRSPACTCTAESRSVLCSIFLPYRRWEYDGSSCSIMLYMTASKLTRSKVVRLSG